MIKRYFERHKKTCIWTASVAIAALVLQVTVGIPQTYQTVQTIYNDVWNQPSHALQVTSVGAQGGGTAPPFSSINNGTNTHAAMLVGSGSSLAPSGAGSILASGLSTDPGLCGSNLFMRGVSNTLALNCTQPTFAMLAGTATDVQVPDLNTVSTGLAASKCVQTDATGKLSTAADVCGTASGGGISTIDGQTGSAITIARGAGIGGTSSANTINLAVASDEPGFLTSGALACGPGTQGEAKVHTTPYQYCDNAATPTLRYAAYGDTVGRSTGGSTATGFFPAGQLETARGGTNSDSSGATGFALLTAGVWSYSGLSGDVVNVGPTITIANNAVTTSKIADKVVTYPKFPDMPTQTFIARNTAGTGSPEALNADTIKAMLSLDQVDNTSDATKNAAAVSLTNKQIVPRVAVLTPVSNVVTPNADNMDIGYNYGLTAGTTVANPTHAIPGNPVDGQSLEIIFKSAAPQTLAWGTDFSTECGLPLPSGTTGNATAYDHFLFKFNSTSGKWCALATTRQPGPVVTILASSTTYACTAAGVDECEMQMTGAAGTLTVASPGAVDNSRQVLMKFLCTNAQTFSWNAIFVASPNVPLPTTCPAGTAAWTMASFKYSTTLTKWQIIATN